MSFISIIVPCRNERDYIGACLESIVDNDYPSDSMEILVIDGLSDDGTQDIIQQFADKYHSIHLLDNPNKIQSSALNIGIKKAKGEIIMRMDAHNTYSHDYISKCVSYSKKYDVDNVGGVCLTLPGKNSILAESIALGLSHPFGVGNAYFRIGSKEPKYVDTVPFGCFKREVFERLGPFDEELVRNQDDEFNLRIIKNGGKILLAPDIVSNYYARESLSKLWKMYFQYGYFKPLVVRKIGSVLTVRQLIPSLFVCALLASAIASFFINHAVWLFLLLAILYSGATLCFSLMTAFRHGFKKSLFLPVVFPVLHFSYGVGYLKGVIDFILFKRGLKKDTSKVPITR